MSSSDVSPNQTGVLRINPSKLDQFLTPKLAKFVIGRNETEFHMHASLVSVSSTRLRSLIDKKALIHLGNVEEDVFSRFTQFVYSGSYVGFYTSEQDVQAEMKDNVQPQSEGTKSFLFGVPPAELPSEGTNSSLFGTSSAAPGQFEQHPARLPYSFASCKAIVMQNDKSCDCCSQNTLEFRVPSKRKQISRICVRQSPIQPGRKEKLMSDFIRTYAPTASLGVAKQIPQAEHSQHSLIGHVKVWKFAREYAVDSLADLACENLTRDMVLWVMSKHTFVPIFGELVRFVYDDCTVKGDKLRHILSQFAACVIEDVCLLGGWHNLVTNVPLFAVDMVYRLAEG